MWILLILTSSLVHCRQKITRVRTREHGQFINAIGVADWWRLPRLKLKEVTQVFPNYRKLDDEVSSDAKAYIEQAISSIHAPAGAVMLAASCVDAMLKEKGHLNGSVNSRIEQVAKDYLFMTDMAAWEHEVRLDANDQRHADLNASLPSKEDAERIVDFASALANFSSSYQPAFNGKSKRLPNNKIHNAKI